MAFEAFYHSTSARDKYTLYSDRNLIDRRNVSSDVSHRVNPSKRFLALTIRARVVAATMKILGMETVDGMPEKDVLSVNVTSDKGENSVPCC